ncbi:putative leader peptide [Streptomyces sp. YIM 130001]|uniref:putative leader peptide n=1 Tax=Streptomyces sp. YIM 130001 TaxID=2259644 RepID=UPI0032046646
MAARGGGTVKRSGTGIPGATAATTVRPWSPLTSRRHIDLLRVSSAASPAR